MTDPRVSIPAEFSLRSMLADVVGTNMVTAAGRLLFPEASNGRLSVLIFHRVIAEPDPLLPEEMTAAHFLKDMQILARQFNVLSLPEALQRMHDGTLPPYALTLTFDDGYRDNFTVALPVLKRLGLPATFFVATGFLDGGRMWNDTLLEILRRWPHDSIDLADWGVPAISVASVEDKRKAYRSLQRWLRRIGLKGRDRFLEMLGARLGESLPTDLMMSSEHVTALSRSGMEIGCHTVSHPILSRVSDEVAQAEIMGAKRRLEALTDKPVRYFAYPNGVPGDDYDIRHVRAVAECGFDAAFSTAWGVATTGSDMYQLPRFTPWDRTSARYVLRFLLSRRQVACKLVS